jgi:hypothetical protein
MLAVSRFVPSAMEECSPANLRALAAELASAHAAIELNLASEK